MPIYKIDCPDCGRTELWSRRIVDGPDLTCECGAAVRKLVTAPNLAYSSFETPGPSSSGSYYSKQFGQEFSSFREFERECAKNGKAVVSKDSHQGRQLVDRARESSAKAVEGFGYSDGAEFQARRKEKGHGANVEEVKKDRAPNDPTQPKVNVVYNTEDAPEISQAEALAAFGVE